LVALEPAKMLFAVQTANTNKPTRIAPEVKPVYLRNKTQFHCELRTTTKRIPIHSR